MTTYTGATDLLATAARAASRSLVTAASADPTARTPCSEWDLATLVHHVADSAAVLRQLIEGSRPDGAVVTGCWAARHEISRLVEVTARAPRDDPHVDLAALTGSFELALHAWDIDQATGAPARLPRHLVSTLLELAPLVLDRVDRSDLFEPQLPAGAERTDTDRLVALFGRRSLLHDSPLHDRWNNLGSQPT